MGNNSKGKLRITPKQYWHHLVKPAFTDTLYSIGWHSLRNAIRTVIFSVIALAIVGVLGGQGQMTEELNWLLAALIAFIVVFLATYLYNLLFATPLRVSIKYQDQIELQTRLTRRKKRETKEAGIVALIYDSFYPCCKEIYNDKSEIHRLGVHNIGTKTLEDVEVFIVSRELSNLRPAPSTSTLSPMHSTRISPSDFTLNPTTDWYLKNYVDFIRWQPKDRTIQLCYHYNIIDNNPQLHDTYKLRRGQQYILSLGVTARDTRIETQWSAVILADKYWNLNIDVEEVEVFEL